MSLKSTPLTGNVIKLSEMDPKQDPQMKFIYFIRVFVAILKIFDCHECTNF